jgi:hypothetical protein
LEAIIINRDLDKGELTKINLLLERNVNSYVFEAFTNYFPDYKRMEVVKLDGSEKRNLDLLCKKSILKFGDKLSKSQLFNELIDHYKLNVWHYLKFRIFFSCQQILYEKRFIDSIITKYDKIYLYSNIEHNNSYKTVEQFKSTFNKKKFNYYQVFKYLIFFILRSVIGCFRLIKKENVNIVVDHSQRQEVLDISSLTLKYDNYILSYLLSKLNRKFIIISDIDFPQKKSDYYFEFDFKRLFEKNKLFGETIILKALLSKKALKEYLTIKQQIDKAVESINKEGLNVEERILLGLFKSYIRLSFLHVFKYVAYKKFFSKNFFKSIVSIDENSPRIKSIFDAAKTKGINTIGIQHGNIGEFSPAYFFTDFDVKKKIIPDYTLVWGAYWKSFLKTECNYPERSLYITGQIRTDIIPLLLNKKVLPKSVKFLDLKKIKIVLFASQPQKDETLRKKAAIDVFNSVKGYDDLFLIFKLHPAEKNDFSYYESIAKITGIKNYKIVYWEDLYALLSVCSLVITCFSTVGSEAVYFKKPLIILDYLNQDLQNYIKLGVGIYVSSTKELKIIYNKFLNKELVINEKSYDKFIYEYAYKIDGKVVDRIINFVSSL